MSVSALAADRSMQEFRHEALFYGSQGEFLDGVGSFVAEGVAAGEPVLVAVSAVKIDLLREQLGPAAEGVRFTDMAEFGQNPARIIPVWQDFVDNHAADGRALRGIGEPVWPGRSPAELAECHRHEALLNVAFAESPPWWLVCPYDVAALPPDVVAEARRTHPYLMQSDTQHDSAEFVGIEHIVEPFADQLPEPDHDVPELVFGAAPLEPIRDFVVAHARRAGLVADKVHDLVLAVNELATNSLRHGGGRGRVRVWSEGDATLCEVRDSGRVGDPLAGRHRPGTRQEGGRGLWLANQLCDLVQLRSSEAGTVVRLHMRR